MQFIVDVVADDQQFVVAGTPVSGGTLHIVAASGPAHLDTVPSYYTTDYQLTHAYTRQLLNYPTVPYTEHLRCRTGSRTSRRPRT